MAVEVISQQEGVQTPSTAARVPSKHRPRQAPDLAAVTAAEEARAYRQALPVLPVIAHDVVLADFPWPYYGESNKEGAAGKYYDLMTPEEIFATDIPGYLSKRGVLFLWVPGTQVKLANEALKAWGLEYRGLAFVWIKVDRNGKPYGATGPRASITKQNVTEVVFAASRVKRGRPMKLGAENVMQTVFAPRQAHSAKPPEVHRRIERLYPNATRLELFARRPEQGWDVIGDELPENPSRVAMRDHILKPWASMVSAV